MMHNDFTRARLRLVGIYLLLIASVIALFSFFVIRQADETQHSASASTELPLVLSADEVLIQTTALVPGKEVTDTEYEIEEGALFFTVEYEGETDVKGNLFTGEIFIENDEEPTIVEMLTDDFDEIVLWIGLGVFLLAALCSIYVANKTLQPIAESIRKQRQFVSGAAHELRNPLAALHARIEAALRSRELEASRGVLEDLLSETKRLIRLSEKLLAVERDEERKRVMKTCSLEECVTLIIHRLHPFIERKHISITRALGPQPLVIDIEDLETLLYNLVHNAVKFSHEGGEVCITWRNGTLSVRDDGVGIPKEHLPHIFERFYTVETGTEGNGLGLALVQDIVGRYGGKIEVKSEFGKGTEFQISFPKKHSG